MHHRRGSYLACFMWTLGNIGSRTLSLDALYPTGYISQMVVEETEGYRDWTNSPKDLAGRACIKVRNDRLVVGNPGNYRDLAQEISELKVDFGPCYRVYYTKRRTRLLM
jgi:putative addiction module killer protein